MTEWLEFIAASALVLLLIYLPGISLLSRTSLNSHLVIALAPALSLGFYGLLAVIFEILHISWSIKILAIFLIALALGLAFELYKNLSETFKDKLSSFYSKLTPQSLGITLFFILLGFIVIFPILSYMTPGAFLQRWDALFHLNGIQEINVTKQASSLTFGKLAYTDSRTSFYPAAFHALASLVAQIGFSVPMVLNASAISLTLIPWVIGISALAFEAFKDQKIAAIAGALALIAPAVPLNEWVHLSPTANAVAFAALPGLLAGYLRFFAELTSSPSDISNQQSQKAAASELSLNPFAWLLIGFLGSAGLALAHPNVLFIFLLLAGLHSFSTLLHAKNPQVKRFFWLPLGLLLSFGIMFVFTWINKGPQHFQGGLIVSEARALIEIVFGLLTVWPMYLGVLIWFFTWLGVYLLLKQKQFTWPFLVLVIAVLYYDAAVDSQLQLSGLWYRGQDRISMVFTMLAVLLASLGIFRSYNFLRSCQALKRLNIFTYFLVVGCLVGFSFFPRQENSALNFDLSMEERARYFDQGELDQLLASLPKLKKDKEIFASPHSGAAHLYAFEQAVTFKVLGQRLSSNHQELIALLPQLDKPEICQKYVNQNIEYVYFDSKPYASIFELKAFEVIPTQLPTAELIFETEDSKLFKLTC